MNKRQIKKQIKKQFAKQFTIKGNIIFDNMQGETMTYKSKVIAKETYNNMLKDYILYY